MYFDFEDYRPDTPSIGSVISWREGVLISVIVHLVGVILLLTSSRWVPEFLAARPREAEVQVVAKSEPMRFVSVEPTVDLSSLKPPPPEAPPSDQDREARTRERAPNPQNRQPRSEGNTQRMVERPPPEQVARGPEIAQPPAPPGPPEPPSPPVEQSNESAFADPPAVQLPTPPVQQAQRPPALGRPPGSGALGDALSGQSLQRYLDRSQYDNRTGGGGPFGPAIQFDTQGVEFGPWVRQFRAQVQRNWWPLIPDAVMMNHGHVVITFFVHRNGRISDLNVVGPANVQAFNTAAFGALSASNPTVPLPPGYPDDQMFITVTFYYNEEPQ
jgi:TonB family protein